VLLGIQVEHFGPVICKAAVDRYVHQANVQGLAGDGVKGRHNPFFRNHCDKIVGFGVFVVDAFGHVKFDIFLFNHGSSSLFIYSGGCLTRGFVPAQAQTPCRGTRHGSAE
jgi:hypothetical protein